MYVGRTSVLECSAQSGSCSEAEQPSVKVLGFGLQACPTPPPPSCMGTVHRSFELAVEREEIWSGKDGIRPSVGVKSQETGTSTASLQDPAESEAGPEPWQHPKPVPGVRKLGRGAIKENGVGDKRPEGVEEDEEGER